MFTFFFIFLFGREFLSLAGSDREKVMSETSILVGLWLCAGGVEG